MLCVIVLFFGIQFSLCRGEGKKFMLSVTSLTDPNPGTWVVIAGPENTTVTMTSPAYNETKSAVIGVGNSTSIPLTSSVIYGESGVVESKGLQVLADEDVSVQVVASMSEGNTEGYQALPKSVWSDEYFVSLYTVAAGRSSFVTVAAYDDDTSVNITIKTFDGQTSCSGIALDHGQSLHITLQSMDVWGVRCDKDLTGTYIKSDKAISVVAGMFDANRFFVEMMIPVQLYGVNFVLPNITDVDIVFRVVASQDYTEVKTWRSAYTVMDAGRYVDINRKTAETMCVSTSKPVQVQMLTWSSDSNVTSFMITIAPIDRYMTAFMIPPSFATVGQRLMLYVTEKGNKQLLENLLQNARVVEEQECCRYVSLAGSEQVDGHLTLNLTFPVMIVLYSVQVGGAEGHSAGFNMGLPTCPTEKGYQYDSRSKFCFKVETTEATWSDSEQQCESWLHHHLATLDAEAKHVAVETFIRKTPDAFASRGVWTGGHVGHNGVWTWPNGVSFSSMYLNWGIFQPDGSAACLSMLKLFNYKWDDLWCTTPLQHTCELRLEALPSVRLWETQCSYENPDCASSDGYSYFSNGDVCIKPHTSALNWTNANALCQAHGGRLVKVDSLWKSALITSFAKRFLGVREKVSVSCPTNGTRHKGKGKSVVLLKRTRELWYKSELAVASDTIFVTERRFFVGGSRQYTSNSESAHFVWTDCSPLVFNFWSKGEPNSKLGDEDCVESTEVGFSDIPCTRIWMFICEKTEETQFVLKANDDTCLGHASSLVSSAGLTTTTAAASTTTAAGLAPTTTAAGLTPTTTAAGLTQTTTAAGLTQTTTAAGLTPTTTAAGLSTATTSPAMTTTAAGLTQTTTAAGLTPTTTASGSTSTTTAAGLTMTTTAAGLTQTATAAGLTPTATATGLTPTTTAAGLTPTTTAAGLSTATTTPAMTPTAAGLTPSTTAAGSTPTTTAADLTMTTTAAGLTMTTTAAGPTTTATAAGLSTATTTTPAPAASATTAGVSAATSPDWTPPGEWNISSWDKNWVVTLGPWRFERVSARWKRLVCRCACVPRRLNTLSPSGVKAMKENFENKLLLNDKKLTQSVAKHNSAKDPRLSAHGMGYSGMCLISLPIILVVLSDVITCFSLSPKNKE